MNAIKIINGNCIAFVSFYILFDYNSSMTTVIVARNILAILKTNMV